MDLSVSPDFDARLCYLIVLLCGLISARIQLYKRFLELKISGVWLVPYTWLMFGIYLVTPLALFWLMDRTSALTDTSLFAALLVGLAYPAILGGGFGGLKAPSGVEGILKPVEAFTDSVIKSVNKATARNEKRFEDFVVGRMRSDRAGWPAAAHRARCHPTSARRRRARGGGCARRLSVPATSG